MYRLDAADIAVIEGSLVGKGGEARSDDDREESIEE